MFLSSELIMMTKIWLAGTLCCRERLRTKDLSFDFSSASCVGLSIPDWTSTISC